MMNYEFVCLQKTALAEKVATAFKKPLYQVPLAQFADGELNIVLENPHLFADKTVVIVQSMGHPVNALVLGIAFLAHELKNAGAHKIIAVIPYFAYSRQERSAIAGKPGYAQEIAHLFEDAGIDELVAVELHNGAMGDFFSIPVHNLSVQSIITEHIIKQKLNHSQLCLIAPDEGIHAFVTAIAAQLHVGMITFQKERFAPDQTRIVGTNGQCKGSIGIIIDDILATGGTAMNVAHTLAGCDYKEIYGYFVHPVFAGDALQKMTHSAFKTIYVSNTLPLPVHLSLNIVQFDVSSLIISALKK